jgi:hypothetical protein
MTPKEILKNKMTLITTLVKDMFLDDWYYVYNDRRKYGRRIKIVNRRFTFSKQDEIRLNKELVKYDYVILKHGFVKSKNYKDYYAIHLKDL